MTDAERGPFLGWEASNEIRSLVDATIKKVEEITILIIVRIVTSFSGKTIFSDHCRDIICIHSISNLVDIHSGNPAPTFIWQWLESLAITKH